MISTIIDVIIGTVYVYVFFSLLASMVHEWVARIFKWRSTLLGKAIKIMLASKASHGQLAAALRKHPLIRGLQFGRPHPDYIPAPTFALALMNLTMDVAAASSTGIPVIKAKKTIGTTTTPLTSEETCVISSLIADGTSARNVQERIEKWFTDSMDRVSGWYKRRTYISLLGISISISLLFGLDTFRLVRELYNNAFLRDALVEQAKSAVAKGKVTSVTVPVGWSSDADSRNVIAILGCVVTALALTLGAPFWFDLLGRLVNLRQTGTPPAGSAARIVAQ